MTPKRSFILTAVILVIGLAVGLFIKPAIHTAAANSLPSPSRSPDRSESRRQPAPEIDLSEVMELAKDIQAVPPGTGDFKRTPESRERQKTIDRQMRQLSPEQLRQFIATIAANEEMPLEGKWRFVKDALRTLSDTDPIGAIDLFITHAEMFGKSFEGPKAGLYLLMPLARKDPEAALKQAGKLEAACPGLKSKDTAGVIILAVSEENPVTAFRIARECPGMKETRELGIIVSDVSRKAVSDEGRLALLRDLRDYLASETDERRKGDLQKAFFRGADQQIAKSGFDSAVKWMGKAGLSASEQWSFFESLGGYTEADTGRWIEWIEKSLPASSLPADNDRTTRGAKSRELVESWASKDHAAAARWLEGMQEGYFRDCSVCGYINTTAKKFPMQAGEWAVSLSSEDARMTMLHRIYERAEWENEEDSKIFAERYGLK